MANFTFIDLFAGIGGIRIPFEEIGGKCLFTSEWDKFSQQTYRTNFKDDESHIFAGDITKVREEEIPSHDVLLAGFPCQPFSLAGVSKKNSLGKAHGFRCETQGTLFFDVARIIDYHRPKIFLLENVKNLLSHDKGKTFQTIRKTLEDELGYHIQYRVIDAKPFVPQHRERIFIIGFRDQTTFNLNDLEIPSIENAPKLRNILHTSDDFNKVSFHDLKKEYLMSDGSVNSKYTLSEKLWSYLQSYAEKHRKKGNGFGYSLVGESDSARTLSARYHKDGSEILIRQENNRPRRLTPRECARLQGFNDTYAIPVSDTQAYRQFGNSVAVPVIRFLANALKEHIDKSLEVREYA
ncbi:MAG: DNA (cytosine-5-)-methyltransferase [Sulfurovum sp.]